MRVRNATDFADRVRETYAFSDKLRELPVNITSREVPAAAAKQVNDQWREVHSRAYVIDHFLAALNWNVTVPGDPWEYVQRVGNAAIEVGVLSEARGTRRFLDYFGFEYENDNVVPHLLVEAKHPDCLIPVISNSVDVDNHPFKREAVCYLHHPELSAECLNREWKEYLDTLRDYCRSVHNQLSKVPRKVLMTNGKWLIIFCSPQHTFVDVDDDACEILVYEDQDQIIANAARIFGELNYYYVANPRNVMFEPSQLAGKNGISGNVTASNGLLVLYAKDPYPYQVVPRLSVSPFILLYPDNSAPAMVCRPTASYQFTLFGNQTVWDNIMEHLAAVQDAAQRLKDEIENFTGSRLDLFVISRLYEDAERFKVFRGSHRLPTRNPDTYHLLTGIRTHFIVDDCSYDECLCHSWNTTGVSERFECPITLPSVQDKAFFPDTTPGHCCHRDMYTQKSNDLSSDLLEVIPTCRSGKENDAFCEIWGIDHFLCCRRCVYFDSCVSTGMFNAVCPNPEEQ